MLQSYELPWFCLLQQPKEHKKHKWYGQFRDSLLCAGWYDIGYNYLVGDDGRAYVGVDYVGEHTVGHNSDSVAISAIGNFETLRPSQAILQTIANLIDCALKQVCHTHLYALCR